MLGKRNACSGSINYYKKSLVVPVYIAAADRNAVATTPQSTVCSLPSRRVAAPTFVFIDWRATQLQERGGSQICFQQLARVVGQSILQLWQAQPPAARRHRPPPADRHLLPSLVCPLCPCCCPVRWAAATAVQVAALLTGPKRRHQPPATSRSPLLPPLHFNRDIKKELCSSTQQHMMMIRSTNAAQPSSP